MNVRNCRKCGRIFNYAVGPILCPACRDELEAKFKEVKKYIQEHPSVGIHEVARECDVEISQIQQWVREERLEFTAESTMVLNCEACGAPIRSGRYCEKCKVEMANGFRNSIAKPEAPKPVEKKDPRDNPRMRFLN